MKTTAQNIDVYCPEGTPIEEILRVVNTIREYDTETEYVAAWNPTNHYLMRKNWMVHIAGIHPEGRTVDDFLASIRSYFSNQIVPTSERV